MEIVSLSVFAIEIITLFYLGLGISLFVVKPLNLFAYNITPEEYWPGFALGLACFATLLVLNRNRIRNDKKTLTIASLALILMALHAIRIFSIPSTSVTYAMTRPWDEPIASVVNYSFSMSAKFMDLGTEVVFITTMVAILFVEPLFDRRHFWAWAAPLAFLSLALISALYTFRPDEIGKYEQTYSFLITLQGRSSPTMSFYTQKNVYGYFLFAGIMSAVVLNEKHNLPFVYWPLLTFLYVMLLFSSCRTVIFMMTIFLPAYFLWDMFAGMAKHPIRNFAFLITVVVFFSIAIGTFFYNLSLGNAYLKNLVTNVMNLVENDNTMKLRFHHWQIVIQLLDSPFRLVFGYGSNAGDDLSLAFQRLWMPFDLVRDSHNGYVDLLYRYGIIGVALYIALMAYMGVLIARIWKKEGVRAAMSYVFVFGLLAVYAFSESKLLGLRNQGSLLLLLFPLLSLVGFASGNAKVKKPKATSMAKTTGKIGSSLY